MNFFSEKPFLIEIYNHKIGRFAHNSEQLAKFASFQIARRNVFAWIVEWNPGLGDYVIHSNNDY